MWLVITAYDLTWPTQVIVATVPFTQISEYPQSANLTFIYDGALFIIMTQTDRFSEFVIVTSLPQDKVKNP